MNVRRRYCKVATLEKSDINAVHLIFPICMDHMSRIGFGGVAVVLKAKGPFAAFHVGEIWGMHHVWGFKHSSVSEYSHHSTFHSFVSGRMSREYFLWKMICGVMCNRLFGSWHCPRPACRAVSIMREARSKLRQIRPEDMDMDEYLVWTNYCHQTHRAPGAF